MTSAPLFLVVLAGLAPDPIGPGNHTRTVRFGTQARPYSLHVPPSYDARSPIPVVLALHPFATNGAMMARISGLNETADREGFLVAYPEGTGRGAFLRWDVQARAGEGADDVGYIAAVLDDLATVAHVDSRRVYATGFSNGGMMCYRLASELSGRVAAVAAVAGTMTTAEVKAIRPVPVLHFHGTKDTLVTYDGRVWRELRTSRFKGVDETVRSWAEINGCPATPTEVELPRDADDGLVIRRVVYGPGRDAAEVVLYAIEGGGHTWPGREPIGTFLGATALDLKANDLIWEFFRKHPMPRSGTSGSDPT